MHKETKEEKKKSCKKIVALSVFSKKGLTAF